MNFLIFFTQPNFWLVIKILTLLFLGFYILFAFIIIKQVQLLNRTLGTALSPVLIKIAISHLIFSIFVFTFAFLIL